MREMMKTFLVSTPASLSPDIFLTGSHKNYNNKNNRKTQKTSTHSEQQIQEKISRELNVFPLAGKCQLKLSFLHSRTDEKVELEKSSKLELPVIDTHFGFEGTFTHAFLLSPIYYPKICISSFVIHFQYCKIDN